MGERMKDALALVTALLVVTLCPVILLSYGCIGRICGYTFIGEFLLQNGGPLRFVVQSAEPALYAIGGAAVVFTLLEKAREVVR